MDSSSKNVSFSDKQTSKTNQSINIIDSERDDHNLEISYHLGSNTYEMEKNALNQNFSSIFNVPEKVMKKN